MKFFDKKRKSRETQKAKLQDTARKLKQAEETLFIVQKAAETAPDAIVLTDPMGNHFYHNKAFTQLVGYTTDDLRALGGGLSVYGNKKTAQAVFDAVMNQGSWTGEIELTSKSGKVSIALLRADAIKDNEGKILGCVGLYTDITERKRKEARSRFQILAWLSERIPEFGALPEGDKEAIQDFLVLWSFFEGTKLNHQAGVPAIRKYVESIKCDGSLYQFNIASYIRYLRMKYYAADEFNESYEAIKMDHNHEGAGYVENMLRGNSNAQEDELIGCLVIIHRLRQNLFYGEHWQNQIHDQYDNFTRANRLLMELIG